MTPDRRRRAVVVLRERFGVSERRACAVVGQPRSTQRLAPPVPTDTELALRAFLRDFARRRPRWGWRRTQGRRLRSALVCLSAGAGLVGADLKGVRGTDVASRFGGVVVEVRAGRRARAVPVLLRYHPRLLDAARWAGTALLIGGTSPTRRNVTTPLTSSLAGGADLPRIDIARLRATWLTEVAGAIGLKAFMDAAGITCSQRLGDLVGRLAAIDEHEAVALIGGTG